MIRPALAASLLCLLAACTSPERQIGRQMGDLRQEWRTNMIHQAALPERRVDWPAAVALLLEGNRKLKQTRLDVTNAQESLSQVFRELIPTLNTRAGVTKSLRNLDSLGLNDVTFSADSFFNVPGLLGMNARVYAARLMLLRARTSHELVEREQTIELYRVFQDAQELRLDLQRLESQRATATAMTRIDLFSGRLLQTELKTREITTQKEMAGLQQRVSDLLGDHRQLWSLETNGLPNLAYHTAALPLTDTNRVAQLQMRLVAIELEGARAALSGMKLRYWPELGIFISGPPIYQRSGGAGRFWDADEVRGSADLFWQLDTRGQVARQMRQARRARDLQMERYRHEALALMDRLIFTQTLIRATDEQLGRVDKQLQLLLAVPPAQNLPAVQKYALDYRHLTQQQIHLRRERSELNALFWFMDEEAWPKHTAGSS